MSENVVHFIGKRVKIGENVRIWHFTYVGDDTEIGDNTKIGSLTHVDYKVRIGRNCKIEGMVYIPPLTVIGDSVFIGPGAILTNDPYPPSGKMKGVTIKDEATIGAGAVILAGIRIGRGSVVGMGSVVTRDVPTGMVVFGNPAKARYSVKEYLRRKAEWVS